MEQIENVVFDLGGVLVDLDIERCRTAFRRLGMDAVAEIIQPYYPAEMIGLLEHGLISFHEACDRMRQLAGEMDLTLRVEYGDFSEKKARELTFLHEKETDVFVCASDLMAIGAMRALMEMDVFHPVCGFDGITLMGYAGKQMNTVRQNFLRVSAAAVEEMARLMAGQPGRNRVLDYELVRMQYQDIIK